MSPADRFLMRLLPIGLMLVVMAVLGSLSACGGGESEPEPEQDVPTPGVDCQTRPELCS